MTWQCSLRRVGWRGSRPRPASVATINAGSACDVYQDAKPYLETALAWIERFNKTVADAIRFLMRLADRASART
jgi:hypothetical protein